MDYSLIPLVVMSAPVLLVLIMLRYRYLQTQKAWPAGDANAEVDQLAAPAHRSTCNWIWSAPCNICLLPKVWLAAWQPTANEEGTA